MRYLSESERQEAIAIITDLYFDVDIIAAVREMITQQRQKERGWKLAFQEVFPPPELEDTQEFRAIEIDGD